MISLICDYNKGKMTMGEALHYPVGLLHYLYIKALKEIKYKRDKDNKNNRLAEILDDLA